MKTISLSSSLATLILTAGLVACQPSSETTAVDDKDIESVSPVEATTIVWEDLMPEGEEEVLEGLYTEFYERREELFRNQVPLSQADAEVDVMAMVDEGSAQDTMEQIGTFNVVAELDGQTIRLPGYVVPLDFSSKSEYKEFLLVPYFGACLHTPPPPPNQIVYVTSAEAAKIDNIYDPVWIEGKMSTGRFDSDLGNSAYEVKLSKIEPYEF